MRAKDAAATSSSITKPQNSSNLSAPEQQLLNLKNEMMNKDSNKNSVLPTQFNEQQSTSNTSATVENPGERSTPNTPKTKDPSLEYKITDENQNDENKKGEENNPAEADDDKGNAQENQSQKWSKNGRPTSR